MGIVYTIPFQTIVPYLQVTQDGLVKGYVTGHRRKTDETFLNIDKLKSKLVKF